MNFKLSYVFACALGHLALVCQPVQAQQDALTEFVRHPLYCDLLRGGPAYASDAVDAQYAQSLAATLLVIGGGSQSAIAQLQLVCALPAASVLVKESP